MDTEVEHLNKKFLTAAVLLVFMLSAATTAKTQKEKKMYAELDTSMGKITCELYPKSAPIAVKSFTGLAQGQIEWRDPASGEVVKKPLYDGTVFHRVIPGFMIQGGDPLGNGTGGPGYRFRDEFDPSLTFSAPGMLAMANSGPDTNGSQFFITVADTSWLNNRHTIFGKVTKGYDIVEKISNAPRDNRDRPLEQIVINGIKIVEK